jgi:hypothetical protein
LGNEPLVIAGASMGGQVSKFALDYMERNELDHCTRLWISLDSPHNGANIPLPLQQALDGFRNFSSEATAFISEQLLKPAAQQMLNAQYFTLDGTGNVTTAAGSIEIYSPPMRDTWYQKMAEWGYPQQCRRVGISNGARNGNGLPYASDEPLLNYNCELTDCLSGKEVRFFITPSSGDEYYYDNWGWHSNATSNISAQVVITDHVFTWLDSWLLGIGSYVFSQACMNERSIYTYWVPKNTPSYDYAPGGYRNSMKLLVQKINENQKFQNSGCGEITTDDYKLLHCFVPTQSALGLPILPPNENIENYIVDNPQFDYFDFKHSPLSANEPHSFISEANFNVFIKEIMMGENSDGSPLLPANFTNQSTNNGIFNYGIEGFNYIRSMHIHSGGQVYVNKNQTLHYGLSNEPVPTEGIFKITTWSGCAASEILVDDLGKLEIGDAVNTRRAELTLRPDSKLTIGESGTLKINPGSKIIIEDGAELIIHPNAIVFIDKGSIVVKAGGVVRVEGATGNINTAQIALLNAEANIIFDQGSQLYIAANTTMLVNQGTASESGYIEFRGIGDAELVTDNQSKLKLVGDGPTDVMLVINNGAELQNANFKMGTIELENCAVDLTNHGRLWTDMNIKGNNVNFEDNSTNTANQTEGGEVQVWWASTCSFYNCTFNSVRLDSRYTYTVGTGTSFSGIRSGFRAMDGRYKLDLCSFDACHLESNSLHNASYIRKCNFNAPAYIGYGYTQPACVYDESLVELYVSETNFTNARQALVKQGGRLSVRCSNFTNMNGYAITANDAALNMSSAEAGGYNNFVDVESCIELIEAKSIHLYQGHNNMGDYTAKCIYGTLNTLCDDANCTMEIDAQQNYWGGYVNDGSLDLQSQGIFTPDMPDVAIEVYTAPTQGCNQNGWNGASMGCAVTFIDNEPEYNTACESVRPQVVISKRLNLEKPSGQAEKLTPTFLPHGQLKDAVVDMGNPIINTATFTNVPLDSALVCAAWHMQMYDSLANDSVAVALFHEILTSGLDRTNQGIRGRMEWGRYNMKTAMENLFYNNQLAQTNNTASFETPVQQYVDVLNTMTDTLLTDSTYKEQFYLELDKGQLFRTLGNPLLARHIYRHLDDCDLDSVEQVQLNNWLAQVDLDISLNQQYIAQNTPPDSIVFAVDTTAYEAPIDYTTSNFYFGVWILSPSQVSFVNCGSNNVYRSMQQSSNNFDIYPNPTTGTFTMSVAQKANYTMSIVDLSGRVVHKCNMNLLENANATITLAPTIASGTYLAMLEYDGGVLFNQLVVE